MTVKLRYVGDSKALQKQFKDDIVIDSYAGLGRGDKYNNVELTEFDKRVSKEHVIIDGNSGTLADKGSYNGTYVNNRCIGVVAASNYNQLNEVIEKSNTKGFKRKELTLGSVQLHKNDEIVIGPDEYKFRVIYVEK